MGISRQMLATLSVDELRRVQEMADDIIRGRNDRRKKELWGNVVAAIRKYQSEVEDIGICDLTTGHEGGIITDMDCPGFFTVEFEI